MTTTTLSSTNVTNSEINELEKLQNHLPANSELGKVLSKMTEGLRDGVDVTLTRDDDELTTSDVASILGISRAHLYKVLDAGLIPFHIVGERTRRMLMSDVKNYLFRTQQFRAGDAQSIAKREQLEDMVFDSMD
ncbi:helix-turn-helix domain-containing protein [Glutamicibacter ectropisis]|uniref:Helix-turn-helix domain-containing protein n=1 Tax=Glutamicibacter ectropisis TaxID=3046593 RepID=A0AAU6WEN0_9MICC